MATPEEIASLPEGVQEMLAQYESDALIYEARAADKRDNARSDESLAHLNRKWRAELLSKELDIQRQAAGRIRRRTEGDTDIDGIIYHGVVPKLEHRYIEELD
jgi:hypothetical protein